MLTYPELDPVALSIGPLDVLGYTLGPLNIHWYGLMYLLAFAAAWMLASHRSHHQSSPVAPKEVEDLVVYGALGVVIGGRCGYVLFYNLDHFLMDPLWLLRVWEGGMSFHGGLLGVIVAMWLFAQRIHRPLLEVFDFIAPLVPLGLGFGRLGNFIGQELWGRPSDGPLAMVFPRDPLGLPRHPSQLYEMFLEGVVLFILLYWFSRIPRPRASVGALFLIGYGTFRFIVEFFREPDAHIGFDLFGWLSRGQLLCIPMVLIGVAFLVWSYRTQPVTRHRSPQ